MRKTADLRFATKRRLATKLGSYWSFDLNPSLDESLVFRSFRRGLRNVRSRPKRFWAVTELLMKREILQVKLEISRAKLARLENAQMEHALESISPNLS